MTNPALHRGYIKIDDTSRVAALMAGTEAAILPNPRAFIIYHTTLYAEQQLHTQLAAVSRLAAVNNCLSVYVMN